MPELTTSSKEHTKGTEWKWWEPPNKELKSDPARGENHSRNLILPKRFYLDHRRSTYKYIRVSNIQLPKTMQIHADPDPRHAGCSRYRTFHSVQPQWRGWRAVSWTRESAEVQVFPPSAVRSTRIIRRPPPDHAYPSHIQRGRLHRKLIQTILRGPVLRRLNYFF
jgi:hypothetical protein